MATKSLLIQVGVDTAARAHNCQANATHRILKRQHSPKGQKR